MYFAPQLFIANCLPRGEAPLAAAPQHGARTTTVFLELGSTTIKCYVLETGGEHPGRIVEELKAPWRLGYEVFGGRAVSPQTVEECLAHLDEVADRFPWVSMRDVVAIGTAALREAENIDDLLRALDDRFGVRVHVIPVGMEAFFLEAAFRDEVDSYPSGVFDLGGGSVEIVEFLSPGFTKKGSIPMGAVRLHCALGEVRDRRCYLDEGRRRVSAVLREHLAACPASTLRGEVFGTGGTVQAIAQVLGKESFGRDELSRLLEHAALAEFRTGVPPHRQTVLLPGMLIVEGLLESLPVDLITYKRSPAKRGFLGLATLGPPVHSRG